MSCYVHVFVTFSTRRGEGDNPSRNGGLPTRVSSFRRPQRGSIQGGVERSAGILSMRRSGRVDEMMVESANRSRC